MESVLLFPISLLLAVKDHMYEGYVSNELAFRHMIVEDSEEYNSSY